MVKNKLEHLFSESMHADEDLWAMKLISNPLTHQNTPADYIIDVVVKEKIYPDQEEPFTHSLKLILVECKMVTLNDEDKGRLAFKRLKQMHDLLNFEKKRPLNHRSYFCIAFWEGRWSNSEIYIVPVQFMYDYVTLWSSKVSMNRDDAKQALRPYRVSIVNGLIDLGSIKYR